MNDHFMEKRFQQVNGSVQTVLFDYVLIFMIVVEHILVLVLNHDTNATKTDVYWYSVRD